MQDFYYMTGDLERHKPFVNICEPKRDSFNIVQEMMSTLRLQKCNLE